MAGEWSPIRLGDVCTKIGSGATPRGGSEVYLENGPFALIRSQNVYNDGFHYDGLAHISEEHAAELANVEVLRDDILLNITGDSVARACRVDSGILPARVNQHVAIIRPDRDRLDPAFLRYFLVSPDMQSKLLSWAGSGGTRNALTKGMIESFDVYAPEDIGEQRAIAHILGTLDDKIELNRRMSDTLEEMARALFKSWFVDFEPVRVKADGQGAGFPTEIAGLFPDRFERSELGDIPAGWTAAQFADVVEILRDQENPLDSPHTAFSHYSIPAFDEGRTPKREYGQNIKSLKFRVPAGVVLLSKLNPETDRVWMVDVSSGDRAVCSTEFLVLRGRGSFTSAYIYCLARSPLFRQQLEGLVTGTSKSHQRAQADSVLRLSVILPPPRLVEVFNRLAAGIFARVACCRAEGVLLGSLRDALLPKLVSGEIRVSEAKPLVTEVR